MFCPFCQKSVKILEKHKKTCLKNPENQKVLQNSPYPVSEIPYLETLPKFLQKLVRVSYICEKCGRTKTQGFLYTRNFTVCPGCRQAETTKKHNLEKYGVENVMQIESVKQKNYETCVKNYGTKRPCQNEEIHKKMNETCIRLYGFVRPNQKPEIQNKIKETVLQRYGVENVMQLDSVKEVHSWSNKTVEQQQAQIQKRLDTMRARFGDDFGKQMSEKLRETKELRYGDPNYCNSVKALDTKIQRYGTLALVKRYIFDNEQFDSKPELAFWIYCKDHGIDVHRNHTKFFVFTVQEKEHRYYPDFVVDNNLIEIKGDHFVKKGDSWQNPFDHSQDELFEAKHRCALQNGVKIYYSTDYQKYVDYVESKYSKDFLGLFNTQLPFPYLNPDLKEKTDLAVIQHFHKSIYEASKKGKLSPLQAWQDKDIIKKVALNRLKYMKRCTPSDILQGLSVTRIAPKISVFKPNLAERLIKQYLNEFEEVVDPFSGFSGRLLGAVKCEKRYIGKDINEKHVRESNEIIQFRNYSSCSVVVEDLLQKSDTETHECLFTCPPYGGKEHWNEDKDEVEKSCDEWIDLCIQHYKCKKYLFVVDETERYKDYVVENLQHKGGLFSNRHEFVVLIDKSQTTVSTTNG